MAINKRKIIIIVLLAIVFLTVAAYALLPWYLPTGGIAEKSRPSYSRISAEMPR